MLNWLITMLLNQSRPNRGYASVWRLEYLFFEFSHIPGWWVILFLAIFCLIFYLNTNCLSRTSAVYNILHLSFIYFMLTYLFNNHFRWNFNPQTKTPSTLFLIANISLALQYTLFHASSRTAESVWKFENTFAGTAFG